MGVYKKELLRVLRNELEFLENGGYGEFEKRSWRPALVFEDSPTCPNHGLSEKQVPCSRCALLQLVPLAQRSKEIPCRAIPLNQEGETLQLLYETATRDEAELKLNQWLRRTIERLEKELKQEAFPLESDTSLKLARA
jgi:hypothetical protein